MVIEDDPEARIAALERQLAELKADLRGNHDAAQPPRFAGADADDGAEARAHRRAEALMESLRSGQPAGPDGPSPPEMAQLRETLARAASDAGMSQDQIDDVLKNGRVTIKTGHAVSYSGQGDPPRFNTVVGSQTGYPRTFGQGFGRRPGQRLSGADRVGAVIGMIGGILGLCVGGAAALTALFPSTALWMSPIVCRSPYHLASSTSSYSYKPGQSGTSVTFQCVSDAGWYEVNGFMVDALQSLLIAFVAGVVAVIVRLVLRRTRNR